MTLYHWDRVANNDATADATINWQEGQAPSSVNDSARGMMAATAKYRDDIAGAIVTTGTSTAYIVGSYQVFDTLAHLSGQMIAFTPHATNGSTVTLNVDSLGAKPLRSAPNAEIPSGTIIQGTPYVATYNNADGAFYLQGLFGNPYNIPIGATLDYWLPTAPNSSFVFPYGQAISRTTYATLYSAMGTTFGSGDGSTTFNIPDLRGRVVACMDVIGASGDAGRLNVGASGGIGGSRTVLGGVGGEAAHALATAEIPALGSTGTASGTVTVAAGGGRSNIPVTDGSPFGGQCSPGAGNTSVEINSGSWGSVATLAGGASLTVSSTTNGTSGTAHNVLQPTILANRIMRII